MRKAVPVRYLRGLVRYVLTGWVVFTLAWNIRFSSLVLSQGPKLVSPQPSAALIAYGLVLGGVAVVFLSIFDLRWPKRRLAAVLAPVLFGLSALASQDLWFFWLFPGLMTFPPGIDPLAWVGVPMFIVLHTSLIWGTWARRPWAWTTLLGFPGLHPAGFIGTMLVKLMNPAATIDEDSFWLLGIAFSEAFAWSLLALVPREYGIMKPDVPSWVHGGL